MAGNFKEEVVIELKNIVKKFGDFTANDNINIKVRKGEIHAILGENGAGKTTLMNQLYGLYKPTSGEIIVHGKKQDFNSSRDAIKSGIGMVHQHFMLIEPFTVLENIILGDEPTKSRVVVDIKKAKKDIIELSKKYGLSIDPDAKIENISVGMQQRVEILKALYRGCDILILDEPTASLTPQEIRDLIIIMQSLTKDGKSIILITHKLKEIKEAADVCSVIRLGKYIDTKDVDKVSEEELANLMVGRKVSFTVAKKENNPGEVVLDIKNLHTKDYRGIEVLSGLNLQVRRGEIVGIAGIDGNGQSELVEIITGLKKATEGNITINGIDIYNKSPKFIFKKGVSSIPEDRQKYGLVLDFNVEDNLILQNFKEEKYSKNGILNRKHIDDFSKMAEKKYDIRPSGCSTKKAKLLSGGNQQKVIIAREVENNKDLLIAFNPTRGLDVGAIEYVHKYLVEQRDKQKAVLLISFELDEIMDLSDNIKVIFKGQITNEIEGKKANEKDLGLMMAGGKN